MPILLVVFLLFPSLGAAQGAALSIGFDGEIVAGRWNPVEFTFRDLTDVTLTITIDQGNLRSGAIPARHSIGMTGGPGLTVIEEDLFVPAWQSFSWSASTAARVVASGTFHPRDLDTRPLAVILSTNAARHTELVPAGNRLVGLPSARLPERLAAWDGVSLLIIDGSTAPPTLEAVAAAASAGANVLLLEPLPASYSDLRLLTTGTVTRLGAGQLLVGAGPELVAQLQPLMDGAALEVLLSERNELELKPPVRLALLIPVLGAYCVLCVLLFRLAGLPGAMAAISLGLLAAVFAWTTMRAEPQVSSSELQLLVSSGGLSRSYSVYQLLDRSGGDLHLAGHYRPVEPRPFEIDGNRSSFTVQRWRPIELARRPVLATSGSVTGASTAHDLLALFPDGSQAAVSEERIEIFLPESTR